MAEGLKAYRRLVRRGTHSVATEQNLARQTSEFSEAALVKIRGTR